MTNTNYHKENLNTEKDMCSICHHHHHDNQDAACHNHHTCTCGHHHELQLENRTIHFEGQLPVSVQRIWETIFSQEWAPQLRWQDVKAGGQVLYQAQTNLILDFEPGQLLSWTWGSDTVSLIVHEVTPTLSQIDLDYWCEYVDEKTSEALTYWLVSLQNLAALAEGKEVEDWDQQFDEVYPKMQEMFQIDTGTMEFGD